VGGLLQTSIAALGATIGPWTMVSTMTLGTQRNASVTWRSVLGPPDLVMHSIGSNVILHPTFRHPMNLLRRTTTQLFGAYHLIGVWYLRVIAERGPQTPSVA